MRHSTIRVLAKVRCAEHISGRIKGPIPRVISDLAAGTYVRADYDRAVRLGLVIWRNGSVLTDAGNKTLDAAMAMETP